MEADPGFPGGQHGLLGPFLLLIDNTWPCVVLNSEMATLQTAFPRSFQPKSLDQDFLRMGNTGSSQRALSELATEKAWGSRQMRAPQRGLPCMALRNGRKCHSGG